MELGRKKAKGSISKAMTNKIVKQLPSIHKVRFSHEKIQLTGSIYAMFSINPT